MSRISSSVAIAFGVLTATVPTFLLFKAVTLLFMAPLFLGILCTLAGIIALRIPGKFGCHVGWVAGIICLTATVVPFGIIAYYDQPGYPIVLVIPDGYRGQVRLLIDRQHGAETPLSGGRYTYEIPVSGVLIIRDDNPFRTWHSETAIYANGTAISRDLGKNSPPDAVSIHSLGSGERLVSGVKEEEYIQYFVGTWPELRQYVDRHE